MLSAEVLVCKPRASRILFRFTGNQQAEWETGDDLRHPVCFMQRDFGMGYRGAVAQFYPELMTSLEGRRFCPMTPRGGPYGLGQATSG
jgi:hypothetical protein